MYFIPQLHMKITSPVLPFSYTLSAAHEIIIFRIKRYIADNILDRDI